MATINELQSIVTPADDSVVVVTDSTSSKKITVSDLRVALVPRASSTVSGSVKVGAGLAINADGTLYVSNYSGYILPLATTTSLGGVIIGAGLVVNNQGVISVNVPEVPVASQFTYGTVKIGTGLTITDGVLSNPATQYVLPSATGAVLGGVKIGSGLVIADSVVSVSAKSYAVESDQTINENYIVESGRTVYSIGSITIGKTSTVTVSADASWVIYTPGTTEVTYEPPAVTAIQEQDTIISGDLVINNNKIASSIGPITIDRNTTVTIPPLSTWIIF
jgi:hypothetical protein